MKARFRYRVYPKPTQISALNQLFGCVRVVWNDALNFCNQSYRDGVKYPGESELQKQFITAAKKTQAREWLSQASNIPLQQSIRDLGTAYQNFFKSCSGKRQGKKVNPPKFKKRLNAQSCRFRVGGFKVNERTVYLAKIGKLKIEWSRPLPAAPSSVTLIRDAANRYFMSFVVEINPTPLPGNGQSVGIDLGITDFATFSTGEKVKAPKPLKSRLRRLKKAQRNLKKKIKGSNRLKLARLRVAKIHAKIKDIRTDFLHKLSTRIVNENQVIALEDLNVSGMVKNRKLSRTISDLGWRSFRTMLEAKAAMYGRDLRVISRWEPTSQKCSCCGEKGGKKQLKVREWECLFCGAIHDRDINASRNIIQVAGGQSETQTGRGGDVRLPFKVAISDETSTYSNLDRTRTK
ncbi:RNA-guided endonuclease TnpB family protein [Chamaesiphon sp. OTE_75_metabat_556]|uniref:RNA-guided endonuclease InsQ/TnpB family protein n=1 Tax=Chamaesiphon sp. OTE_75_metabat_556 TaxID=2964692 RepID=UPI00286AE4BC|nr:RNA-guided endonuclease TnpB family protein [Chamaesiphon sp. OTE_75_metabat_556]